MVSVPSPHLPHTPPPHTHKDMHPHAHVQVRVVCARVREHRYACMRSYKNIPLYIKRKHKSKPQQFLPSTETVK